MANYGLPQYDKYRDWINTARRNGKTWDEIEFACCENEEDLYNFLARQKKDNWWDIDIKSWSEIVLLQKEAEENTKRVEEAREHAILVDESQDSAVYIPTDEKSSWQLYKRHLLNQGFHEDAVSEIEHTTEKLLKRLNGDTQNSEPVKGLVIGNVQSGKTANMAALMAMAADWGWNMFIILSGTIENLRNQTQRRLLNDLNQPGNIIWRGLEHLSKKTSLDQRTQYLHFEHNATERYFTVCLKNKGRLKNLIEWLQADRHKQKQLRILVIDDEADQAGINTANISTNERKAINKLIVNLVNGNDAKGKKSDIRYNAMNYIGYTATPYANILNESSKESLYPRSFIATLKNSNLYFGPQQIFGVDGGDYDGLDIVRLIDEDKNSNDLEIIKDIHDGYINNIPKTLINAVCWFLCGSSAMRLWDYRKPISMLIHTSQIQNHHEYVAEALLLWLKNTKKEWILGQCKKVWEIETEKFNLDKFREQYNDYGVSDSHINTYPDFSKLIDGIELLLSEISNIKLGEDNELEYHKGIHVCIDNCKYNKADDGNYIRLAYPEPSKMPFPAPAFIVIGGATLSRGLTIEGLFSTYFLRSVSQADTLMQMGRWFGYRKGYELLPRIWMTNKTKEQFVFLSTLDYELREQISEMDVLGKSPSTYGPKLNNTPKYSFIRITAKNRMQCAIETDLDYSGTVNQTILFDNDKDILNHNKNITEKFINMLGQPIDNSNLPSSDSLVWENIPFSVIYNEFLANFKFNSRSRVFNDMINVNNWINKVTAEGKLNNWNIIVSGKGKANSLDNTWKLHSASVNKINRSRRGKSADEKLINIGVLRAPKDLIADVNVENLDSETKSKIKNYKPIYANEIRMKAGLETTPQLIIYCIDKDSKSNGKENRADLNAEADIIGLCINVPGGKAGTNYAAKITVKLDNEININDDVDLEDIE